MHNALSFQRVHQPKGYTVATYHPETNMAYAHNPKGPHFAKMGQVMSPQEDPLGNDGLRGQRLWLLPEEVLYLLERGSLDVRWPNEKGEEGELGLPMSLQGAYAMFIGNERYDDNFEDDVDPGLTFERYSVYSGLKRMGYTVLRARDWNMPPAPPGKECYAPVPSRPRRPWYVGLLSYYNFWESAFSTEDDSKRQDEGPLVGPRLYRNYADIYRRLALINYYDPARQTRPSNDDPDDELTLHTTFYVWKPGSQTFKKSNPGPPDFRIAVINARETALPTLPELSSLLESTPYDPPPESAQLYQKLKHGYKNVVLAIVDQGVVSYLRIADAAFGREKLFERTGRPPAGKRGGRGGRGRGRGR